VNVTTIEPSLRKRTRFSAPRHIELAGKLGPWRESLRLPDGRKVVLRPIEPADAAALQAGFSTMSPEDIRLRFLHPMTELTSELAAQLANPDSKTQFALVIAEPLPPGEALVGAVARASVEPGADAAEFALFVARPLRAQGVGAFLLRKLVDWARRRGLSAIYGDVLHENTAMLTLAERLGFVRAHVVGDQGVMRIVKTLDAAKSKPKPKSKSKPQPQARASKRRK
jgi:RimJ/RimL family protein N-acetyltransferase